MGFFYSINTLGALIGTILAGFILIQIAGINYSNIIMVFINATAGIIAIIFGFNILDKNENFSAKQYEKKDVFNVDKIHKSDYEYLVKNNCQPKNNDVLFSKDGTIGLCLVYTQPDKIVVLSSIAIIRTKPDELDPNFLKYVLQSRYMQVYLAKFKSGTALKRIILKNISEFTFPLPPTIKEQEKIASILSNLDLLIQQEKQYKEKLEKIKRGLMQQLLTGKTRVKV